MKKMSYRNKNCTKYTCFYLMDCQYNQHYFYSCARAFRANMFGNVRARDPRNVIMSGTWRELSLMNGTDPRKVSALTSLRQCAADAEP